jgi:diguanylate cyclase (GGDEF)-like protein
MDTVRDRLTGFYTEKYLKEGIESEFLRAGRYDRSLTFVLFKFTIPEKFHMDMFFPIYKRIAKEILAHTRKVDIRIRMGDRVLMVLPETNEEGAKIAARKITETLTGVEFYHETYQEYFHLLVNYAIGVFPRDGKNKDDIMKTLNEKLEAQKIGEIPKDYELTPGSDGKTDSGKVEEAVKE